MLTQSPESSFTMSSINQNDSDVANKLQDLLQTMVHPDQDAINAEIAKRLVEHGAAAVELEYVGTRFWVTNKELKDMIDSKGDNNEVKFIKI